jgi:hypothetical protein
MGHQSGAVYMCSLQAKDQVLAEDACSQMILYLGQQTWGANRNSRKNHPRRKQAIMIMV